VLLVLLVLQAQRLMKNIMEHKLQEIGMLEIKRQGSLENKGMLPFENYAARITPPGSSVL